MTTILTTTARRDLTDELRVSYDRVRVQANGVIVVSCLYTCLHVPDQTVGVEDLKTRLKRLDFRVVSVTGEARPGGLTISAVVAHKEG